MNIQRDCIIRDMNWKYLEWPLKKMGGDTWTLEGAWKTMKEIEHPARQSCFMKNVNLKKTEPASTQGNSVPNIRCLVYIYLT